MKVDLGQQPATVRKEKSHESADATSHPKHRPRRVSRVDLSPLKKEKILVTFSGGKDAIVAGDISLSQLPKSNLTWVFFYFVEGLEVNEVALRYYERRWGIKIHRRPCHQTLALFARREGTRKRAYKYYDVERAAKEEFGVEWVCSGWKKDDNFARRGVLKKHKSGIIWDTKRVVPVADWSDKRIYAYLRARKLPLPPSYSLGLRRSLWIPDANRLLWLRNHYPRDYERIVTAFPEVGDAVFKKMGEV